MAADAAVRVVLVDGGRPLTATKKVYAKTVPTAVRLAAELRDRGDRFPGSRAPVKQAHLHHFDAEERGHHIDHVAMLSPASHRRIHRFGWSIKLDPATAAMTFVRDEQRWTTLPRGTRLRRPPPGGDGGGPGPPWR